MQVKEIKLRNYRNINNLNLKFSNNINIIIGKNGVGKTNIIESIYLIGLTKSFRTNFDNELIMFNKEALRVEAKIKKDKFIDKINLVINDKQKKISLNDNKVNVLRDYIGLYPLIISTPEDIFLIKGSPGDRRSFLNISISQFDNKYIKVINEYNRILKHRNDYLKEMYLKSNSDSRYFDIMTDELIKREVYIYQKRYSYIEEINNYLGDIYKNISLLEGLKLKYKSLIKFKKLDEDAMTKLLKKKYKENLNKEIELGITTIGPHRDDFDFMLKDKNMKIFSSEGEKKLAVISLKLSEMILYKENKNLKPVILYDDLFSELDIKNRNRLINYIPSDLQVFITSNDLRGINKNIKEKANIIKL